MMFGLSRIIFITFEVFLFANMGALGELKVVVVERGMEIPKKGWIDFT